MMAVSCKEALLHALKGKASKGLLRIESLSDISNVGTLSDHDVWFTVMHTGGADGGATGPGGRLPAARRPILRRAAAGGAADAAGGGGGAALGAPQWRCRPQRPAPGLPAAPAAVLYAGAHQHLGRCHALHRHLFLSRAPGRHAPTITHHKYRIAVDNSGRTCELAGDCPCSNQFFAPKACQLHHPVSS